MHSHGRCNPSEGMESAKLKALSKVPKEMVWEYPRNLELDCLS